jgi:hypothetical protein
LNLDIYCSVLILCNNTSPIELVTLMLESLLSHHSWHWNFTIMHYSHNYSNCSPSWAALLLCKTSSSSKYNNFTIHNAACLTYRQAWCTSLNHLNTILNQTVKWRLLVSQFFLG